jgi:hypothetical protein
MAAAIEMVNSILLVSAISKRNVELLGKINLKTVD